MKTVNVLIGLFFGSWAIGTLVLGLNEFQAPASSLAGLIHLASSTGAFAMLALVSVWSFQAAYAQKTERCHEAQTVGRT